MSILNIKNFPDDLYERLREQAERDRRSISQEVIQLLTEAMEPHRSRSILELRGLGRAAWSAVDAARHVTRERESWD